jgi:hypothetical protein
VGEPRAQRLARAGADVHVKDRATRSLAGRAILALALLVGFYAMGAAIVLGLLWVPWAQVRYEHGVDFSGIACGIFGVWIAIALLPRFGTGRRCRPTRTRSCAR